MPGGMQVNQAFFHGDGIHHSASSYSSFQRRNQIARVRCQRGRHMQPYGERRSLSLTFHRPMIADLSYRAPSIGCSPSILILMPWSSETPPRINGASLLPANSPRHFLPSIPSKTRRCPLKRSMKLDPGMEIRRMVPESMFPCRFMKLGESFSAFGPSFG